MLFLTDFYFTILDIITQCNILYNSMGYIEKQEKLDILTRDFEKLEENWKDYIWELTQKLVDIHCEGFSEEYNGNDLAHGEI